MPVPEDDEVLIRIHATTFNRTDTGLQAAKPFSSRFVTGICRPKRAILGMDLAGEVEAADRTYPLEDVAEATKYVETGHKTGNVVLTFTNDGSTKSR